MTCVASERSVILAKTLSLARHLRLIDLGMPANVDVSVQNLPGVAEVTQRLQGQGIKIGSSTGFIRAMVDILEEECA